jgi:hypothetical protein
LTDSEHYAWFEAYHSDQPINTTLSFVLWKINSILSFTIFPSTHCGCPLEAYPSAPFFEFLLAYPFFCSLIHTASLLSLLHRLSAGLFNWISFRVALSISDSHPSGSQDGESTYSLLSSTDSNAFACVDPAWIRIGSGGPLQEFSCGPSTGSQSNHITPAGQSDEVPVRHEDLLSTAQFDFDFDFDGLDQSWQGDTDQEPSGIQESSEVATAQSATEFRCTECFETFAKPHQLR